MRPVAATLASIVLVAGSLGAQAPARNLQLTFHPDHTVTLVAANVTVREILAEWARQCGCYVVNWDKLTSGPLTMPVDYTKQPQAKVLESLLRQAAGYVLTPRRAGSTSASNFETIYILATSSPVGGAYVPPPSTPASSQMPTPGSPEDEIPAVLTPQGPAGPQRPGMPTQMPGSTPPPGMPGGRPAGTPSVFVPIVPITSTPGLTNAPGMPTAPPPQGPTAPPMPVPIVPAPQNR